jgi:CHAT domain-containing protein
LLTGCSVNEFEATGWSATEAIATGKVKEFLSAMEAKASVAEKNALSTRSTQAYWKVASSAYGEASWAARSGGQLQKSLSYAQRALETAEKAKDPHLQTRAMYRLASVHAALRQYAKANEWAEKGLEIAKQTGTERLEGEFYRLLGSDYLRSGDLQKAIEFLSRSLQIQERRLAYFESVRRYSQSSPEAIPITQHLVLYSLHYLGSAYRLAGRLEDAKEGYEKGLALINSSGLKTTAEGNLYQGLAQVYLAQKNYPLALVNLTKALRIAEEQKSEALLIYTASNHIGDIYRLTQKPAEAMIYYIKAIENVEATRSLLPSEEQRQAFFEGGLSAYVAIVNVLLQSNRIDEAFNYSERARSRSFLDVLGSKVQLSRAKSGLFEEERALQERIAAVKARLTLEEEGQTQGAVLSKELAQAERAYSAFLASVRKHDKEQASLMSVEPLNLKEVQGLLDPGTTLVEYFVAGPVTYVWVVEKDRVEFSRTTIARKDLVSKVTALRDTIYQFGEKERFNTLAQELHKLLVQPALPHIKGKELIIVPHDVLHYLPFQALIGSDGRYLIEKYPINYLSSASLLQFTKEKSRAMGERVLALGNPDLGDPKMSLQFAGIEAKEIKNLYPQSTIYLEKEATEEKAKTLSPTNDIIHFASHAELNEDDPLSSAVLLAKSDKEDGRLEVREIFGMDLKASLVVLSACETGLGKLSSGDELVGLTRAFIYAGTPSVVASLWNVEDSSTAQLMSSFYKNLKTMTKVEALRQAQLNLIRGNVNTDLLARRGIGGVGKLGETPSAMHSAPSPVSVSTSHPYFWAPFILVGDGK